MSSPTSLHGKGNELSFVYGHDTKKFRLRAVSAEKEVYSKFINKPVAKKISLTQLAAAFALIIMQVVTTGLVVGRYNYYDNTSMSGAGIWVGFLSAIASASTLFSIQSPRYWKLHLSFALHILSVLVAIFLVTVELFGTIPSIRYRLGQELYENKDDKDRRIHYGYDDKISVPLMVTSLALNSVMACLGLGQIVSSFIMTIMSGRAICCGQSKAHGKIFELDMAGSETAEGYAAFKKALQTNKEGPRKLSEPIPDTPPTYQEAQVV